MEKRHRHYDSAQYNEIESFLGIFVRNPQNIVNLDVDLSIGCANSQVFMPVSFY